MRAPFNAMLPLILGVSILMRGAAAIATSRLTTTGAAAGGAAAGALGAPGAPACGVAGVPAGLPGCGACLACSIWACCARCFSICGMLKKYCQPISTRPDRMTARMVLRLSVIVQGLVIQFGLRLARESLLFDAVS